MDTGYTQIRSDYIATEHVTAADYNSLVKIVDSQVHGALEGVGSGVISGGAVTAGSGLSVNVSALKAVADTDHLMTYLETEAARVVSSLPASSTVYIHARAVFASVPDDEESRETAYVDLFWSDSDTESDAVLLATVETGVAAVSTITDGRTYIPAIAAQTLADTIQDSIDDLEDAVGDEYFGGSPPATSLHDRVTVIEGAGAPGVDPVSWGGLQKVYGADDTTVEQEIDAAVDAHEADYHAGDVAAESGVTINIEEWDVDSANQARLVLKLVRSVDPDAAEDFGDCAVVVWDVFGDGTTTPDFVDHVNSTWVP